MSKVGARKLSEKELFNLLSARPYHFLYLEKVTDVRWERYALKNGTLLLHDGIESPLSDWNKGTAFSEDSELRWERGSDGRYHTIFTTDADSQFPIDWDSKDISHFQSETTEVFLWGKYDKAKDCWLEGRIPRLLYYPLNPEKSQSPKLKIVEYYHLFWDDGGIKEERFYRMAAML